MLLGDADVVSPFGNFAGELVDTGAAAHGSGYSDDFRVLFGQAQQGLAKHFGVGRNRPFFFLSFTGQDVKRCHGVKFNRILLRRRITFALGRHYVHERGAFDLSDVFESGDHLADVVTVNGADVLKPQALEQKSWRHQSQEAIANLPRHVLEILAARQAAQQVR